MAFVRWRGNTAQVLASAWKDGKSVQVRVCSLPTGERTVTPGLMAVVARELPDVTVDWQEIQTQLDAGPQGGEYMRTAVQLAYYARDLDMSREDRTKMREVSDWLMSYALRKNV